MLKDLCVNGLIDYSFAAKDITAGCEYRNA
jgi:hypothetical protein